MISMKNKKLLLTGIAFLFFISLIIGATYAYVTISSTNSFGTKKVNTNLEAIDSISLTTGSDLNLKLTLEQMSDKGEDVTYYASSNGTTTTETSETIGKTIVTGNKKYNCDYTITVDDNENSLYDVFQKTPIVDLNQQVVDKHNQIVLIIDGEEYDFATANLFPKVMTGTLEGLTRYNNKEIKAQLKFVNKTGIFQTGLVGSSLNITFTIDNFSCTEVE